MVLQLQSQCSGLRVLHCLIIGSYRQLSSLGLEILDVFEQQASFGGAWNYFRDPQESIDIPQTDPFQPVERPQWLPSSPSASVINDQGRLDPRFISPMYDHLETNIPHVLMKHPDAASLENHQLFPTRQVVVEYLAEYANPIRDLVRFQCQVVNVSRERDTLGTWVVQYQDLRSGKTSEISYDAVLVASGHYTVPMIPQIKGITRWNEDYKGAISHSKLYRRPDPYTGKKVIIVGNSASGVDIASQIASVCKHPILNATRSDSPLSYTADYKKNVPQIEEFLPGSDGTRAVRFANGHTEENVDAVLFCTGYYYSFPFLPSVSPNLISTGDRVQHLYKHIFYIPDPTLAFIGLPSKIIPFRTFESQAAAIAGVWSHALELPTQADMVRWEEDLVAERGDGRSFHVLPFPKDFQYHNDLVDWVLSANVGMSIRSPRKWDEKETWLRERFPAIKKAFADKGEERHKVKTVEELGFDYQEWLQIDGDQEIVNV